MIGTIEEKRRGWCKTLVTLLCEWEREKERKPLTSSIAFKESNPRSVYLCLLDWIGLYDTLLLLVPSPDWMNHFWFLEYAQSLENLAQHIFVYNQAQWKIKPTNKTIGLQCSKTFIIFSPKKCSKTLLLSSHHCYIHLLSLAIDLIVFCVIE